MSSQKKDKVVTLRPKGNGDHKKNISTEPEMKELKRMIRSGELRVERILSNTIGGGGDIREKLHLR